VQECTKCKKAKEDSCFYQRKTGQRNGERYTHCIECLKLRGKEYYANNRDRQSSLSNLRRRAYRIDRKDYVAKLKDKPCADCGKKYPHYVMDFDHLKGSIKRGNISELINRNFLSYEQILVEVAKCDIVCANCHRIRTFSRINTNNDKITKK
jgi:hypothetical protein